MYSKKILSTAAAIAVLSTGLMAFDTNTREEIVSEVGALSSYLGGVPSQSDLNLSANLLGDALIYPYYTMKDGWKTEIVVRNTTPRATVAKVGLYKRKDSQELVDFNIYLSPFDVARFEIRDGNIYTSDGSIARANTQTNPKHYSKSETAEFLSLADVKVDGEIKSFPILGTEAEDVLKYQQGAYEGYVIVYGMTQYQDDSKRETPSSDWALSYHDPDGDSTKAHLDLWKDYRLLLDACRPGWRDAFKGGMQKGVMTVSGGVPAPDTNIGCGGENGRAVHDLSKFGDVTYDTLTGTVRIYKEDGQQSRDLLLPATALSNFTDGNMVLWAEGEYAALQDRRIEPGAKNISKYNGENIRNDAKTFLIKRSYYTYSKDSANKLLITQPMKRVLVQLGNQDEYWYNVTTENRYGGFSIDYNLFDEDEVVDGEGINISIGTFTSPYSSSPDVVETLNDEVQILTGLEVKKDAEDPVEHGYGLKHNGLATSHYFRKVDATTDTALGNGFVYINFNGNENGLPAIVTQMTGSKIDGLAQTNWIYAPVISNNKD